MIYTGWGVLGLILFLCVMFASLELGTKLFGVSNPFQAHPAFGLGTFALGGLLVWCLGRWMNRRPLEVEELRETGRVTVLKPRHTIFFVRLEYWGPIFFVLFSIMLWMHS